MAELRNNRVKAKLREGKTATVLSGFNTPEIIDFLGPYGFDAMWIETEHAAITWEQVAHMTRACDLWGMTSLVRVNSNEPWLIIRTLDVGAMGVVVPHVNSKEAAEAAMKSTNYGPTGYRGMYTGRQSYGVKDYHRKANDEVLVVALLEEQEAISNLKEILTVDGIDVFLFGPSDLAQTMGYTGQPNHPEVRAVIDRAIADIVAAGRVAGSLATADTVEGLYGKGVRFFLVHWEAWLVSGAREFLEKANSLGS